MKATIPKVCVIAEERSGSMLFEGMLKHIIYYGGQRDYNFYVLYPVHDEPADIESLTKASVLTYDYRLHPTDIHRFMTHCREHHGFDFMQALCDANYRFFRLTRRNKIKQAISLEHAMRSGVFHTTDLVLDKGVELSMDQIRTYLAWLSYELVRSDALIDAYGIEPFEVVYEKDLEARANWRDLVIRCENFIGVKERSYAEDRAVLKKTANATTRVYYDRVLQECFENVSNYFQ